MEQGPERLVGRNMLRQPRELRVIELPQVQLKPHVPEQRDMRPQFQ
jgi:hypothetical protein